MEYIRQFVRIGVIAIALFAVNFKEGLLASNVRWNEVSGAIINGSNNVAAQQQDTSKLRYPIPKGYDPKATSSPLLLSQPQNIKTEVTYSSITRQYTVYFKIGNVNIRPPMVMNEAEYRSFQFEQSMRTYWQQRRQGETRSKGSGILPRLEVGGETFDRIFGSNVIEIIPQGNAELIFGITSTRTDNNSIAEELRRNATFDFQSKIQMNVNGTVGEKLRLEVNYNTEATFEFEQNVKVEYTGFEDEIIQKIEAGNVSLPLPGSLITGSHSLFGLKTQLKFGHLTVTSIFSKQNSQTQVMEVRGGAQAKEFEVQADEYESNKHFFLSHYFRDQYNQALQNLPIVNSGINVTRIEVWVTNKRGNFDNSRDVLAFHDIAENSRNIYNPEFLQEEAGSHPRNTLNSLYRRITGLPGIRSISEANQILAQIPSLQGGMDYEKIENARMLTQTEFNFNPRLGYISLNISLNADEILAVAYEYTLGGQTYRVGELSTDGVSAPDALVLKLLKGTNLSPRFPTWNLMMKNIYNIGAFQVNSKEFNLNILYQNDLTGTALNYLPEGANANVPLLSVLNLDNLNTNQDPGADGMFDFIDGITIGSANGRIIFPVLEPFGRDLARKIGDPAIAEKYTYQALYDSTLTKARQIAEKNKFRMVGTYQSSSNSEIPLNAMNVPKGSVVVTAGGMKLVEGSDFTVDYIMGTVKIINPGLLESGTPIQISLESQNDFGLQTKTLVGSHFDYKFSDKFNIGATILNLTERPYTQKVAYGNDAISNTIWGLNSSYQTEVPFLTKAVDLLPFIETKEKSTINFDAEFAHFMPGYSKVVGKGGKAYVDDFEGTKTSIDLRSSYAWTLASVPQNQPDLFPEGGLVNDLTSGYNRALIAWYTIDPLFLRNKSTTPGHIRRDPNTQSNHFVREIFEKEIFPNRQTPSGIPTNIPVLNLAFYPSERGPYNFSTSGINSEGLFSNPRQKWAGMMRSLPSTDFETTNIEYIEFWLMDPFVHNDNHKGGDLYFNLGEVSEDVLSDGRRLFEHGLPVDGGTTNVDETSWGRVPSVQSLVNAFDNNPDARRFQDVGLDGMRDEDEEQFHASYLAQMQSILSPEAYANLLNDPSGDNFRYYRSSFYDSRETGILDRYKRFNMSEGNSPAADQPNAYGEREDFPMVGTIIPDGEDINNDHTLNENENYYQYRISLRPEDMLVGQNFITDKVTYNAKFENGERSEVNWYQFKVPIDEYERVIGNIQDFKSIRFLRLFMKGFADTTILRFATLELVRGEWRRYNRALIQGQEGMPISDLPSGSFEVSAVNIEENYTRTPVNYVLPPGVTRVIDPSQPQMTELNEQSMALKVLDLADGDARAVFRNVSLDIRQYRRLMMDVHAEEITEYPLTDDELTLFVRLGTDYNNNYYEYEIPLKLTPPGKYQNSSERDRKVVWPRENLLDIDLELFQTVKMKRNDEMRRDGSMINYATVFAMADGTRKVKVAGNPSLSNVRVIMIGVRNPSSSGSMQDDGFSKSGIIWVNELLLSQAESTGGWAANARVAAKLADLAMVSVAGTTVKPGFGSIEKKVNERNLNDFYQYDLNTTVQVGRFFPKESGVNIPLFVGFSESFANPEFNPLDPDVPLEVAIEKASNAAERDSIRRVAQDYTKRKSINLTNVRINKSEGAPKIYSLSNFAVSYSFNEQVSRNINTVEKLQRNVRGGLTYSYNSTPKNVIPLKNVKWLSSPYLRIIKDFNFNYIPNQISFRTEINRTYFEQQLRNISNPDFMLVPTYSKDFSWNRVYSLNWDISQALKFDLNANNIARIDEPMGMVNKQKDPHGYETWRDSVWTNLRNLGRNTNYNHQFNATYNIPINKLPLFNWVSASARYTGSFNWQAGPILPDTSRFDPGNTIQNASTIQLNSQLNFTTLYNKAKFLKEINQKFDQRARGVKQKKNLKTVTYEQQGVRIKKGFARRIVHNLKTEDVKVMVTNEAGEEVKVELSIRNDRQISIKAEEDYSNLRVAVEGKVPERENVALLLFQGTLRMLMGVKNVSASFARTAGTLLPGYKPETQYMGISNFNESLAPGFPFIAAWQDPDFAWTAVRNGWLTNDSTLNAAFALTQNDNLNLRATVEPISNLRIELSGTRTFSSNKNEFYIADANGKFNSYNPMTMGNFSISIISLKSAFERSNQTNDYLSESFSTFRMNRNPVAKELASRRAKGGLYNPNELDENGFPTGYGMLNQEVLIYSFISAYTGTPASKVELSNFPMIPMPNWQLTYDGLSKIKPFSNYLRTFSLRHSYRSTFTIGSYATNLNFAPGDDGFSYVRDIQQNFVPEFEIANVSINEQLNPLISMDATWLNSLTNRLEIRKTRSMSLSFANNQLSEISSWEIIVGSGYRFENVPLNFVSSSGEKRTLKSDLRLNLDFSLRNNKTIMRKLVEETNVPSAGQDILTIKTSAEYVVSDQVTIRAFFDRVVNKPTVNLSYGTANTSFGFSIRFTMAQ